MWIVLSAACGFIPDDYTDEGEPTHYSRYYCREYSKAVNTDYISEIYCSGDFLKINTPDDSRQSGMDIDCVATCGEPPEKIFEWLFHALYSGKQSYHIPICRDNDYVEKQKKLREQAYSKLIKGNVADGRP